MKLSDIFQNCARGAQLACASLPTGQLKLINQSLSKRGRMFKRKVKECYGRLQW